MNKDNSGVKDIPIKAKQLIFHFSYKYGYDFGFEENIVELYPDEFTFFNSPDNIEIDDGIGGYQLTAEIFVPVKASKEYIKQIESDVRKEMENWFKRRIKDLTHGLEVLRDEI